MPMAIASYMETCLQAQRPVKERLPVVAMASKAGALNWTDKKQQQVCSKTQPHEAPSKPVKT